MNRKYPPSLKRYLVRTSETLRHVRLASEQEWRDDVDVLCKLVVVLEDRRFFQHHGLDWRSFAREFIRAATFRKHGGASTIEMQFVRTVTGRYERTIKRKIQEAIVAFLLDYHVSKPKIIRGYLRVAYFGTGIWGIDEAKLQMFGKEYFDELTLDECAILASMLVYPRPREPNERWRSKVNRRAKYGLSLYARLKDGLEKSLV